MPNKAMLHSGGNVVLSVHPSSYAPDLYDLSTQNMELIHIPENLEVQRGWGYDRVNTVFYPPRPYASWSLDNQGQWHPPIAKPTNHEDYYWDEGGQTWHDAKLQAAHAIFQQTLVNGLEIQHTGDVKVGTDTISVTNEVYHLQARKDPDLINIGNVLGRIHRMSDQSVPFSWRVRENVRPIKPLSDWVLILEGVQDYYEACIAAYHVVKDTIQSATPPADVAVAFQSALTNIIAPSS